MIQLSAVAELAMEDGREIIGMLIATVDKSTPRVREAILSALVSRSENFPHVLKAIEDHRLSASAFSAVQRRSLLEARDRGFVPALRSCLKPAEAQPGTHCHVHEGFVRQARLGRGFGCFSRKMCHVPPGPRRRCGRWTGFDSGVRSGRRQQSFAIYLRRAT